MAEPDLEGETEENKSCPNEKRRKESEATLDEIMISFVPSCASVLLGITFYLKQIGYLSGNAWMSFLLAGIGIIFVIQGLIGYSMYHAASVGSILGGLILLTSGVLSTNFGSIFWPLLLVAIGVAILCLSFVEGRTGFAEADELWV